MEKRHWPLILLFGSVVGSTMSPLTAQQALQQDNTLRHFGSCEQWQDRAIDRWLQQTRVSDVEIQDLIEDGPYEDQWYRALRKDTWIWQGLDDDLIDLILAKIIGFDARRDNGHFETEGDTLDTFGGTDRNGAWVDVWKRHGDRQMWRAQYAEPWRQRDQYLKAATLYNVASYPHLHDDAASRHAYSRANDAYRAAGEHFEPPLVPLHVPYNELGTDDEIPLFLHLPPGDGPFPVVVVHGGVDVTMVEHFPIYQLLKEEGIAMVTMDIPGVGNSRRWPMNEDQTRLHHAVVAFLAENATGLGLDSSRIAIWGMSFGGNLATKAAFEAGPTLPIAAAINMCGATGSVFTYPLGFFAFALPGSTVDAVASTLHLDPLEQISGEPATFIPVRQAVQSVSLYQQGYLEPWFALEEGVFAGPLPSDQQPEQPIRAEIPLLNINTTSDVVGSLEDMARISEASTEATTRLYPEYDGHCAPRPVTSRYAVQWLKTALDVDGHPEP